MKKNTLSRLFAVFLALALVFAPTAQALTVEQARTLLTEHYVDEIPPEVLNQPTIADMITALGDPYTAYFTPEEYQAFTSSMEDASLVGIGITYGITADGNLTISETIADSPAEKAGLQAGDIITAIDDKSTIGVDIAMIKEWVLGEKGTALRLTYLRNGVSHTSSIIRDVIAIPATSSSLLNDHIGYLTCTTFGSETLAHFQEAFTAFGDKADQWILDLRSNGGGQVDAAVQSVGLFTGTGNMAYFRNSQGQYSAAPSYQQSATAAPVVVLTNGYTASASELFSATVRDLNAGIVVGGRTYGKGVSQVLLDQSVFPAFFPEGGALKVTSNRYFSPNGTTNDTVGVIPHLLVTADQTAVVAALLRAAPPKDTAKSLRLDMGWYWYIDLDYALNDTMKSGFLQLLEAIPLNVELMQGTGGADGWEAVTPAAVAAAHGLPYQSRGFTDSAASPYGKQIDILGTYSIVDGPGDGTFNPNGTLTRAELCALLAQALWCTVSQGDSRFTDVSTEAWYSPAVNALANMGLVSGTGDGLFHPTDPVDHQQFFTVMARVAALLNMSFYEAAKKTPADPGFSHYADWARNSMWLLTSSQEGYFGNTINLLWNSAEEIDPVGTTTRGEAALVTYNLLLHAGQLPS